MQPRLVAVVLFILSLAPSAYFAWTYRDMPHLGHYDDDSIYWVTGRALAEGRGYRISSLPEEPLQTKYPPVFPVLMAAIWKLWPAYPENLALATLLVWVLIPLYALLARRVFLDLGIGETESWVLGAVLAASPGLVLLGLCLMSDVLCAILTFVVLILVRRAPESRRGLRLAAAAGAVASLAYLTRTAALPVIAAGTLWLLWRKQGRQAAVFAAVTAPAIVAWGLWVRAGVPQTTDLLALYYSDYLAYYRLDIPWGDRPVIALRNIYHLLNTMVRQIAFFTGANFWADFAWRLLAFGAVIGVVRRAWRNGVTPYDVYGLLVLPMLLLCPWAPDTRELAPVLPLLWAGLFYEGLHLAKLIAGAWRRPVWADRAVAGMLAGVLVLTAGLSLSHSYQAFRTFLPSLFEQYRTLRAAESGAYQWISKNVPSGATFLAYNAPLLWLDSGHRGSQLHVSRGSYYRHGFEQAFQEYLRSTEYASKRGRQYILATAGDYHRADLTGEQRTKVQQALASDPRLRTVYHSPMVTVYRIEDR